MSRRGISAVIVVALIAVAIVWKVRGRSDHATSSASTTTQTLAAPRAARAPVAPAILSGHVTRSTGGGVGGATVAIARASADMKAFGGGGEDSLVVVATDAGGAWTADKVAPGRYAITVSARGFVPARHEPVAIGAGEHRDGIDVVLQPGGTIVRGSVDDVGGGGIPGARVSARGDTVDVSSALSPDAPFVTVTGGDGKYELALPDGPYRLAAAHDDYTSSSRSIALRGKALVVNFSLVPGAVIRGQVVARGSSKPIPGARIEANGGGRRRFSTHASATADGDGRFVLRHLSSGTLALTASGEGYASQAPTEIAVAIGEQVDGVRVVVDPAASIIGRVVKKGTQQGIAGVMVGAGSMSSGQSAQALEPTDKDGGFQIVGVRPGSYIVYAFGEEHMPELSKSVDVANKDVTGVVIEMSVGATLSGRVDPAMRSSIGLALVGDIGIGNIMEAMRSAMAHADSDARGNFVLRHAPAGRFTLVATTVEGPAGKLPVVVGDADQKDLVIALETRASISGHVIDTNHAPVAGTRVTATELDMHAGFAQAMSMMKNAATTADDGSFKIVGLEAGKYMVSARDPDDFMMMFGKDKKQEPIELAAGADRTGVVVTVEAKDGVIRGTVIGSDGKPAADAWVSGERAPDKAMPAEMSEYSMLGATPPVLTSADGKFALEHLHKGTYKVIADGPRGGSRGEKAGVATGDTVTITLAPLGTLAGHVMARGAPVAAYDLLCRGPAGRVDRHVEASDGAYALEHLAPGHYSCAAEADAGTATGESEVPTGAATLELQLVPWASIVGTVVSVLTGAPVPGVAPIVSAANDSGRGFVAAILGNGPTTDASGKFTVDRVAAGSGSVSLYATTDIMRPLATKPYTATQGQQVDLGTIKIIPPRTGDAGTLGMATEIQGDALAVTLVQAGGPAAAAGLVVGDKITAIDGKSIADLTPAVAQQVLSSGMIGVGMQVVLTLDRGAVVTLTAAKW